MKPVIIHDPDLNLSAVVDTDTFQGWGPAIPGPDGRRLLGEWLDTLPDDPAGLTSEAACSWFLAHLQKTGEMPSDTPEPSPAGAEQPPAGPPAHEVALAEREAQNAGDGPPAVQPADTDPTAGPGPTPAAPPAGSATDDGAAADGNAGAEPPAPDAQPAGQPAEPPAGQPATTTATCPTCQGTGTLTYDGENGPVSQTCPNCAGAGKVTVEG